MSAPERARSSCRQSSAVSLAIEREVPDAQLRERAAHAQPLDRQRRVGAAGEHDPQLLGGVAHEKVDRRGRLGARQLVDLVEHEHQRGVAVRRGR